MCPNSAQIRAVSVPAGSIAGLSAAGVVVRRSGSDMAKHPSAGRRVFGAPQEGIEPPTKRLEGSCSIH